MFMSKKALSYVHIHRTLWDLTQSELASLLPKGGRRRVRLVEQEEVLPNAGEILAYRLIFGASPKTAFPDFFAEVEEKVMRGAYKMYRRLEADHSPEAALKRKLLEKMMKRATRRVNRQQV
jgi:hypothetical protein